MLLQTYFRNYRSQALAYTLNILRLILAFAPFIIIAAQLKYDLSFDKFHPDYKRLYRVERYYETENGKEATPWISFPLAEDIIASSPYIEAGAVVCPFMEQSYVTVENQSGLNGYSVHFIPTTPEVIRVFHFEMVEGRAGDLYSPGTVLIPESLAIRMFPGESAIDKTIISPDHIYMSSYHEVTVKGVYKDFPENSQLGNNGIYVQMDRKDGARVSRGQSNFNLYLKLTDPNVTSVVIQNYTDSYTDNNRYVSGLQFTRLSELYYKNNMPNDPYAVHGRLSTTITLASIVILLLLIAGINFTNFSMAMIPFRIKSINTRKVLGSSVRSLRLEMIAHALISVLIALCISIVLVYCVYKSSLREVIIADFNPSKNPSILILTGLIALFIGVVAELFPSRYITSFQPALVLKGSFGLSGRGRVLRQVLLTGQFIISIVLIAMSLIIHRQNTFMRSTDIGIDKEGIAMMSIGTSTIEKREAILEQLGQIPEVVDVAFADDKICTSESYQNWGIDLGNGKGFATIMIPVSWNMMKVLGIPIEEGRDFRKSDGNNVNSMIVTRNTKENENLEVRSYSNSYDIVGVCSEVHVMSLRKALANTTFLVNHEMLGPSGIAYVKIQKGADMAMVARQMRDTYARFDPYYPAEIEFFDSALNRLYKNELVFEKSVNWCAMLAILISMLGIFGLIFFDTQQRRKEMALRRIMGAENRDILWNINRPYLILLGICFAVAVPIVVYISDIWMKSFQYQAYIGPGIYIFALLIILVVTLLTINIQAYRSIRSNPVDSIKIES